MQSNPWPDRILAMLARACAFGAAGGAAAGARPLTVLFLGACAAALYEGAGIVAKRYLPPDVVRLPVDKDVLK